MLLARFKDRDVRGKGNERKKGYGDVAGHVRTVIKLLNSGIC